ncbi:MAG TPA: hypothetical protein DCF33_10925 [Saprospirales bacterium]|nr:hypothetical protein [Saprospirales bacterium]
MKINIFLGILVITLAILTCKNIQKTKDSEAAAPAVPAQEQGQYGFKASHVIEGERADTIQGTLQIKRAPKMVQVPVDVLPPPTASKRAYLSTGWWHLNMAYQPSDTTVHQNYQSKWLQFREDQTFDILIKGKVVDTGRWNFDSAHNEILLSCKDPYINNSWSVQEKGFVMIWKGNTSINVTGIQVRVVGSRREPEW